jgi:uncharacterized membrane protein YedE/YeeE
MSVAGLAAPLASRPHAPVLLVALGAISIVLLAILALPDAALPGVFAASLLLGVAFVLLDVGFAGSFRDLLNRGDGRAAGANFAMPAVAALVIVPVAGLVEGYGRFIAPVGMSLAIGAALFGVGMQIANGCGSGVLVSAGQGSRRMVVALPFFCLGGLVGSLLLPMALMLPSLGEIDLAARFGPWGGLLATEALLAIGAAVVLRGAWPG